MSTGTEGNDRILRDRWQELKGMLKQRWSRLTDEDISNLSGSREGLVLALRFRYGYAQAQAMMEIDDWLRDLEPAAALPQR